LRFTDRFHVGVIEGGDGDVEGDGCGACFEGKGMNEGEGE